MRRFLTLRVLFDAIAIALVLFVVYRLVVAPRALSERDAYPAPAARYEALSGAPFDLAKQHGKVVFLEFYASWCTPCKVSLPLVESFARSHPEVRVVPVDVGEPREVAAALRARRGSRTWLSIRARSRAASFSWTASRRWSLSIRAAEYAPRGRDSIRRFNSTWRTPRRRWRCSRTGYRPRASSHRSRP